MKIIGWISRLLLIIGGLNWGLIGLINLNLVNMLLSGMPGIERIVYIAVGVAAILAIFCCGKKCCNCGCSNCNSNSCHK